MKSVQVRKDGKCVCAPKVSIILKYQILCCYESDLIKGSSVLCFQVAIKSIRKEKIKDEQDMVHIRREIEIMSSLRHPHIISIYEGEGLLHVWKYTHTHTRMANHTPPPFIWTHINKNTSVQNSPLPQLIQHLWPSSRIVMSWHADVIIRPGLQLWDVIHLLCSVWLPGPVKVWMALTVCIWISQKMCVCTCVLKVSVCKKGGILRDCLSHIWEVSSLAFSRLDLRARHLLILRDNCSWEPEWSVLVCVCVCTYACLHGVFVYVWACVHVCVARETLDWPQSPRPAPDSGPVLCGGRKGLKPSLEQRQHISCPGSNSLNIKGFKPGSYCFAYSPFEWPQPHWKKKLRLELIVSVKVEQFPLNSFNILLAINHPL